MPAYPSNFIHIGHLGANWLPVLLASDGSTSLSTARAGSQKGNPGGYYGPTEPRVKPDPANIDPGLVVQTPEQIAALNAANAAALAAAAAATGKGGSTGGSGSSGSGGSGSGGSGASGTGSTGSGGDTSTPPPAADNTMLYLGVGAAALVAYYFLVMKK
jgi:hypothetical protein